MGHEPACHNNKNLEPCMTMLLEKLRKCNWSLEDCCHLQGLAMVAIGRVEKRAVLLKTHTRINCLIVPYQLIALISLLIVATQVVLPWQL